MSAALVLLLAWSSGTWLDVPFSRQTKDGCGSASIWMLMEYWQPRQSPSAEAIHRVVFSSEGGGVYASDMERYFTTHGFRTLSFRGEWADLGEHVTAARPLIVSLESNARGTPLHYVVVAGVDAEQELVLVNDPADRKLRAIGRLDFEERWRASGNWTLLAVPADESAKVVRAPAPAPAPSSPSVVSEDLVRASSAFRGEDYGLAKRYARRAVDGSPQDPAGNELLATLYFLDNNLEAAIKYWNRVARPRIRDVTADPPVRLDPVRLDRAFAFSRADLLRLDDYRRTTRRLDATGAFSSYTFDLTPTASDDFDLTFRSNERSGVHYLSWLGGLPFQTIRPEIANIGGRALHFDALYRWDRWKRRASASLSGPLGASPSTRFRLEVDGRHEEWERSGSRFPVRKVETALSLSSLSGSRTSWSSGLVAGSSNAVSRVGYIGGVTVDLLRLPEHRLTAGAGINVKAVRSGGTRFVKTASSIGMKWYPKASGRDMVTTIQLRSGAASKDTPVDELFVLGLDRDGDLLLRAHPATRDGRKGEGVMGLRYGLLNTEIEKSLHEFTLIGLAVAPFLDVARTKEWFLDAGLDFRIRIASVARLSIAIGRDLRAGRTAWFADHR